MKTLAISILTLALAGPFARPVAAEPHDPADVFIGGNLRLSGSPLLSVGEGVSYQRSDAIDYALFARELLAFVAKEVISDSEDEFRYNSEIPSRLSDAMPPTLSRFGAHCLIVLNRMGSAVSPFSASDLRAHDGMSIGSALATAARVGGTLLAVEQIFASFKGKKDKTVGDWSGMELDPKVGSTFGAYVTVRW